jgi:hypothetical protein
MTVFALFKVHLDPIDKDSYFRSMVKFDLTVAETEKYQKFLESKENYTTLETKIKQNIRHKKEAKERKEREEKESKIKGSTTQKFSLLKLFYNTKKQAIKDEKKSDFFTLRDKPNNAYHHIKIASSFLYVIVTDDATVSEKNKQMFLKIEEIEEKFSNFKKDKREKTEEALKKIVTTYNAQEAKEKRYSSSNAKVDYSFFHICCGWDTDKAPSQTSYKRLK